MVSLIFRFKRQLLAIGLILCASCSTDSDSSPEILPPSVGFKLSAEQREKITPTQLKLLQAMERGEISGETAAKYRSELHNADKVEKHGSRTSYSFHLKVLDPEATPADLYVVVHDKTGLITGCGVTSADW